MNCQSGGRPDSTRPTSDGLAGLYDDADEQLSHAYLPSLLPVYVAGYQSVTICSSCHKAVRPVADDVSMLLHKYYSQMVDVFDATTGPNRSSSPFGPIMRKNRLVANES